MIRCLMLFVFTVSAIGGEIISDLEKAMKTNDDQGVIKIIQTGYHVVAKRETGNEALKYCAAKGLAASLELLVKGGSELDDRARKGEYDGFTALNLALKYQHEECAEILIQHGADPNLKVKSGEDTGITPLMYSMDLKDTKLSRLLLDSGAKVNTRDKKRMTPLFYACLSGNFPMVRLLLDKGAKVKTKDTRKWTPLFYAVRGNDPDTVMLMLKSGLSPVSTDTDLMSPSDYISVYIGEYQKSSPEKLQNALKIREMIKSYLEEK